jgi:hypothetical protein
MPKVEILVDNKIKCGYQNDCGKWIILPVYEDIFEIFNLTAGDNYAVKLNKKWGVINEFSDWVLQPIYENIELTGDLQEEIIVIINGKHGVIDLNGKYIIEPKYDLIQNEEIYFEFYAYLVSLENKTGIFSHSGDLISEIVYDIIIPNSDGGYCKAHLNKIWGRIGRDGKFINENEYEKLELNTNSSLLNSNKIFKEYTISSNKELALLSSLNKLVGLTKIKREIFDIYSYVTNQKIREEMGLQTRQISYHMIFYGPPGTGKTTVARIVAEMFKEMGILKKGHFIEADRSMLVGEYLGQTAPKVNQVVDRALDGILFIDEAYSLFSKQEDIFAKEAINTLIKRIEDDRDRLIVILAGYKEQMESFIDTNPGFKSRFNLHLNFENYSVQDLMEIFKQICHENDYIFSSSVEESVLKIIELELNENDIAFSNARYVRNLFETITKKQSRRLISNPSPSKVELQTITLEDLDF